MRKDNVLFVVAIVAVMIALINIFITVNRTWEIESLTGLVGQSIGSSGFNLIVASLVVIIVVIVFFFLRGDSKDEKEK